MKENNPGAGKDIKEITPELFEELVMIEKIYQFEFPESFQVIPEGYLKFAEMDLSNNTAHGDLNSVFNSKKAVHCQIDILLWNLGFLEFKKLSFPKKLEILRDCGIVAPNILSNLNHIRNYLEHDYKLVERKKAQELNDIAVMFVQASTHFFSEMEFVVKKYLYEDKNGEEMEQVEIMEEGKMKLVNMYIPSGSISIDQENKRVKVKYRYAYKRKLKEIEKIVIKKNQQDYCRWIFILMKAQTVI